MQAVFLDVSDVALNPSPFINYGSMDQLCDLVCEGCQGDLSHGHRFSKALGKVPVQGWSQGTGMEQCWGQEQQSLRVNRSISSTAGLGQREEGEAGKEQALAWPEGFIAQPGSGACPKSQS